MEIKLTTSQVAALLRCTTSYVREYLDLSLSPTVVITPKGYKQRRYDLSTVEAYAAQRAERQARIEAERHARDPYYAERYELARARRQHGPSRKRGRRG